MMHCLRITAKKVYYFRMFTMPIKSDCQRNPARVVKTYYHTVGICLLKEIIYLHFTTDRLRGFPLSRIDHEIFQGEERLGLFNLCLFRQSICRCSFFTNRIFRTSNFWRYCIEFFWKLLWYKLSNIWTLFISKIC